MKKIEIKIIGEDGNIFNLLAIARRALKEKYRETQDQAYEDLWQEVSDKVYESKSYDEALMVLQEHFRIT